MYLHVINLLIFLLHYCASVCADKQTFVEPKKFFVYRTNSIIQRACTCNMSFSCSCCEYVVIVYQKGGKRLCVNFTYQSNGLNIDISLDSNVIKSLSITNYNAFTSCVSVPRCFFSTVCANILELNQFSRSITACLRLDILAKKDRWQIDYNCISLSTELPSVSSNSTPTTNTGASTVTTAMPDSMTMTQTNSMTSMTEQMSTTPRMAAEETTGTLEISEKTEELTTPSDTTEASMSTEMMPRELTESIEQSTNMSTLSITSEETE